MNDLRYQQDLYFMKQTLLDHHPGPCNKLDPEFTTRLETAFSKALVALEKEASRAPVVEFTKSFEDAHLWVFYRVPSRTLGECAFLDFEIKWLSTSLVYARVPTFYAPKKAYAPIVEALESSRNKSIVFDLRGNTGGSSFHAELVLEALFGKTFKDEKLGLMTARESVEWRVSAENLKHLEALKDVYEAHSDKPALDWINPISSGMCQALKEKKDLFLETKSSSGAEEVACPLHSSQVVALIDGRCASATLDFLDGLKVLSNKLVLIGQSTGCDSLYNEVREVTLPSAEGVFGFPIKVYRDRFRGHNQPYHPDIKVDWKSFPEPELEAWLSMKFSS